MDFPEKSSHGRSAGSLVDDVVHRFDRSDVVARFLVKMDGSHTRRREDGVDPTCPLGRESRVEVGGVSTVRGPGVRGENMVTPIDPSPTGTDPRLQKVDRCPRPWGGEKAFNEDRP